ncbi:MAG: translation initiation factor [Nitrospirae bacterium]|nr:translation initiation factor [Nitrospirota bacterium]
MPEEASKLVYSTEKAVARKERPAKESLKPALGAHQRKVTVRLDRKRRGGKSVTIIDGLHLSVKDTETLLKKLKAGLGAGGTVRDSSIEIQGDHCGAVITVLSNMGYRPKRSGGS